MTKTAILVLLVLASGVVAEAGIVRGSAKLVAGTAKVATHPVRHPVKDSRAVTHAAKKVVW
jgi:hypothetical protein